MLFYIKKFANLKAPIQITTLAPNVKALTNKDHEKNWRQQSFSAERNYQTYLCENKIVMKTN